MFWDFFKRKSKVEQAVGKVVHFFDRLNVAVVRLSGTLAVGDKIKVKRGEDEFTDVVTSIQVNHVNVENGGKGDEVAILLSRATKDGARIYKV
ncbi:MAG: hypothetical protein A3J93_00955 [Candidatus Magasanikbacteria bacterium RIFOXYC2_FULL_42_28]|uniref:Translation elongation factor-like protein n=1 Tax=Candidatus Magasanikbacteria bacterium RIFOXYC2_FULL_42_28 TaxID=1798704 RepID=A0A1F6NXP6_9BACT|nr:MAG: hypothetical protein A3J93_00955 [Candidatus Magasanikbacteria bacterium RIFOXYC2_FULL_42_28]